MELFEQIRREYEHGAGTIKRKIGAPPGILGIEISVIKINKLAASGCGEARLHRIFRENK